MERDRERDRQTDRQTDTERQTQRDRQSVDCVVVQYDSEPVCDIAE